jgi:hypothetical protein
MGRCSSGKIIIDNESLAQEELVRVLIKYGPRSNAPNGYYICEMCGGYHLTSKSADTSFVESSYVQERIRKGRIGQQWGTDE